MLLSDFVSWNSLVDLVNFWVVGLLVSCSEIMLLKFFICVVVSVWLGWLGRFG